MANRTVLEIPASGTAGAVAPPPWGTSVLVSAQDCDPALVRDKGTVAGFLAALVDAIGMRAYGEPEVVEFGEGGLHGLSAKQWIYTSSLIWHAGGDGAPDEAYLDVFTCGGIEPPVAARIHDDWFGGTATVQAVIARGRAR
jgi:S-adenosylmethionine/arginine decarboxylase-like enzyme